MHRSPPGSAPAKAFAQIDYGGAPAVLLERVRKSIEEASGVTVMLGEESTGVTGSLGWHSGTFKINGSGGATVGTGKYLELWRKKDGKWLIVQDIWNNDAPAAAPPTK